MSSSQKTRFKYSRKFYEKDKEYFESLEEKQSKEHWFKDYFSKVLEYSNKEDIILECGCGTGITTSILHQKRPRIIGTDFSESYIRQAKKRGNYFKRMDVTNIRFKDSEFDLVCSADMIEHVPRLENALEEMTRVLKNNGYLVLQTPNLSSNLISVNYRKTFRNVLNKLIRLWGDLFSGKKRTIENHELDVLKGDKDAYTLMSPIWLTRYLKRKGYTIKYMTTYSLFFEPSRYTKAILNVLSRMPITKYMGGRIIIVAQKNE
ncbi:class I SAM-dependent methyltransferase [Candidatus Pacearchaeota archaeon]|nr:class I SAM-dependent methyltransferase [Candidatus Pacearchaeota archaeon]